MKSEVEMFMSSVLKTKLFDFSGYPKDSVYYDDTNKKVLGKMKDEFNGVKIDEFVALKSKMYLLISGDWEMNKAKGVNLNFKHKEYVDVLFNKKVLRHKMKRILSEKHSIGTFYFIFLNNNYKTLFKYHNQYTVFSFF